ncbi:M56 family metallopeptidase [Anaerovorax odorimutans]|uniref:M56 family metallopeptidase n=1 Tax=Anaerovorax odorimutans TaxID=109327 RepID=UPI00041F6FDA|nr:M56 family metallopeptidase [Anaerovorax odorimutans]
MINYFFETILIGGIVSILIASVYILTPLLDKLYLSTWRLGVWKICITFSILPIGLIIGFLPSLWNDGSNNLHIATPINLSLSNSVENNIIKESFIQNSFDIGFLFFIIWFLGVCSFTIYYIIQYYRFLINLKNNCILLSDDIIKSIRLDCLPEKVQKKPLKIYQNSLVLTPMIVGIINPRIIIPKRNYDKETLTIIIEHETIHFLRKDLWWKLLCIFSKILHWYNPLIYIMSHSLDQDIELCCDLQVLKNKKATYRNVYSDVILKEIIYATHQRNAIFACMGNTEKSMKKRFKNIFTSKVKRGRNCIVLSILILFIMSIVVFSESLPQKPSEGAKFEAQIESLIQQKEQINKEKRGNSSMDSYYVPNYKEVIDKYTNDDGIVDTNAVYEELGIPLSSGKNFDIREKEISYALSDSGYVGLHILINGDIGAYFNEKGALWELKKGQEIVWKLWADSKYYGKNSGLIWGYVKDGEYFDIETLKSADLNSEEKKLSFKIPEDGSYYFYLLCTGDGVVIKGLALSSIH